ncbi:hypothetical protein LguiB_013517 [Lonicera macranthoides]
MRWTASEYVKVINRILIVHNGTIQKFNLHIPIAQRPDMDLWILILSRNGVVSGVEVEQQKDFNLMVLLSKITEIRILWLDGFSLKFLAAGTEKEYLAIKVYNLAEVWFELYGSTRQLRHRSPKRTSNMELKSCISKAALHFAKLLLSHSPSLERMTIDNRDQSINTNEQLRIAMDLMRFPRASTKAELIYLL